MRARYDVLPWDPESHAIHKQADRLAAASEAVHVAGWSQADLSDSQVRDREGADPAGTSDADVGHWLRQRCRVHVHSSSLGRRPRTGTSERRGRATGLRARARLSA